MCRPLCGIRLEMQQRAKRRKGPHETAETADQDDRQKTDSGHVTALVFVPGPFEQAQDQQRTEEGQGQRGDDSDQKVADVNHDGNAGTAVPIDSGRGRGGRSRKGRTGSYGCQHDRCGQSRQALPDARSDVVATT